MKTDLKQSINSTISYFQVFEYFLNFDDLYKFLHSCQYVSKKQLSTCLNENFVKLHDKYIIPSSEKDHVELLEKKIRLQEKKRLISVEKKKYAEKIGKLLGLIPSVKLIAISGNLGMLNADENDDIDFFVISAKGTAWTSRMTLGLILFFLGKKRMFKDIDVKNKICMNFILDEENLLLKKQNLYSAHEIAQMKTIFNKNDSYDRFINQNIWVKKYLFNFWSMKKHKTRNFHTKNLGILSHINRLIIALFRFIEPISRAIQIRYMKNKITKEVIGNGIMMFHPRDYSGEILSKYKKLYRLHSLINQ